MEEYQNNKILLVEDDKIDQMAFERFVKKNNLNYDYTIAGSVEEAKEALHNHDFEVVLLDYLLGDGTAFDVFNFVNKAPVIFITGGGNELIAVKAIKQGAFDYLIKDHERNYLSLLPISIQKAINHKIAEAKWLKAERERARLSWVLSKTDNSIVITDETGKVKWVNDGFTRLTGYTLKDIKGTSGELLRKGEKTGISPGSTFYEKVFHKKRSVSYEAKNYTKDENEVWVFTTLTPMLNKKGDIQEVVAIDADITKRKRTEQELRFTTTRLITLIDNLIVGVLFEDELGKIIHVNKKYCEMFRIRKSPNELTGKSSTAVNEKIKEEFTDPENFISEIVELAKKGKVALKDELLLTDERIIERSYIPIKADGEIKSQLWIFNDISARKKGEKDLIQAKQTAERSAQAKEEFLANISHEIRTPMNAIIGLSQLLLETKMNEKQQQYLQSVNYAADNLLVLINDILDLSKIEARKINFEETEFKLRDLIKGMADTVSFKIDKAQLNFVTEINEQVPEYLKGDPVRLNQILMNLVGNAIKFTKEGEVKVTVNVLEKKRDNVLLDFIISDTGIGIPEEKLPVIFDAFKQAYSDTTRKFGGTGLGLAIVKQLVELQNGKVSVKSKEGEGSSFSFFLSYNIPDARGKNLQAFRKKECQEQLKGKRILLVEDNELNQMLAETFLKKWGAEVEIADNGVLAVEKITEMQGMYDLVLMDIQMPEMDGYQASRNIRKLGGPAKVVPILAMTAHAFRHEEQKCLEAGMNAYVSKPLKPAALYSKIVETLENSDNFLT